MNLYRKITIENLELSDIKNIFVVYYPNNTHRNNKKQEKLYSECHILATHSLYM